MSESFSVVDRLLMSPREREAAAQDDYIRRLVDAAPPLTETQRAKLAVLLAPPERSDGEGPATGPLPPPPPPRCALYRHYDADDVLLYVGVSVQPVHRGRAHARTAHWIDLAHRADVEWFNTKAAARAAEIEAIRTENPLFNRVGASPDRRERVVAYLVSHKRLDLLTDV